MSQLLEFGNDALLRGQVRERACRHVLRHLGVAHLDDVGRVAAGERGVELAAGGRPRSGTARPRSRPGCCCLNCWLAAADQVRPARLRVDLQPDGDLARRALLGPLGARGRCRRHDRERQDDGGRGAKSAYLHRQSPTDSVDGLDCCAPARVASERGDRPHDWFIPLGHGADIRTDRAELSRPTLQTIAHEAPRGRRRWS